MNNPLITISIPTFNSEKFIELCLTAVFNQTYKNFEVNIIDGNSKDRTREIAKKFNIQALICPEALLEARYQGTKLANGEYILLLDSDQVLEPDALEKIVNRLNNKNCDTIILGEDVYKKDTFVEKLFHLDRKLVHTINDINPDTSVMLPRFYKKEILLQAFSNMNPEIRKKVGGQDHAIIFYEVNKLTNNTEIIQNLVKHIEPNSLLVMIKKFFRWGKTSVGARFGEYDEMLKKKEVFRKGLFSKGLFIESLASITLLLIKGIPYKIGYFYGKCRNK